MKYLILLIALSGCSHRPLCGKEHMNLIRKIETYCDKEYSKYPELKDECWFSVYGWEDFK